MRLFAHAAPSNPESDMFDDSADGSFHRILVVVHDLDGSSKALRLAARTGRATGGRLRLVHVRMWEPPGPGTGRFYPETSEEATALLDSAMSYVWKFGVEASGIVVEAQRSSIAAVTLAEASRWGADVIVVAARLRHLITIGVWDRAARQIMQAAACPLLVVHPGRS